MTDLSPLITALEKAEGPSRELDVAIHEFLCPTTPAIISGVQPSPGFGKDAISMQMDPRPRYTSSLDAAIALTEQLLPGWDWIINSDNTASVYKGSGYFTEGANRPIALVLAALKGLAARTEREKQG